ncbi:MAG: ABC transporter substrate-binding protein, partial [Bdellovibrionota bacterium]
MKNRYSLGKIFLSLFIFGALSGCTHHDNDGNLAVFHTYEKDDVKTWDPANAYDMVSLDVMPMVMETPYQYTYLSETFKVEPLLADGMPKYSADHLTVTIKFKKGVKFQDDPCFKATAGKGREFKAQDMIYGFKRLALPSLDSQGWWILDGKVKGINEFHDKLGKADKKDLEKIMDEEVEGLKALDDYTIQIKLLKPYPQLQYALAMGFASPVAREAVAAYADEKGNLTNNPVGTGPFIMKRWDHNRKVVLEKNPNFRTELYPSKADPEFVKRGMLADAGKPLPFVDRIDIDIIKEDQPRWLSFLDGKQDTITIPKDNISQALTNGSNLAPD